MLKFSKGNVKLQQKGIVSFSLPSGFACPFALSCKSMADRETGKIQDTPETQFRCFSASQEALYSNTRKQRWDNFQLLRDKSKEEMVNIILNSLPQKAKIVRVHVAGDFFNQNYFDAWMEVARQKPELVFYAYTKSLFYWVNRLDSIPQNFKLNASKGGRLDNLIETHKLKFAQVVYSEEEAKELSLEIDHDDTHAYEQNNSFALLIHGTQPKNSKASKELSKLRKKGIGGYSRKKNKS